MAMPKPSEARVVVTHHEDGRMKVTLNGEIIPGVIGASVTQEGRDKAVLQLSIIGNAFRMETSPMTTSEARRPIETEGEGP